MTTRQHKVQTQLGRSAARIFAANERMNQMLIEELDTVRGKLKRRARHARLRQSSRISITFDASGYG